MEVGPDSGCLKYRGENISLFYSSDKWHIQHSVTKVAEFVWLKITLQRDSFNDLDPHER